jgi:hypothetical protein
MTSEDTASRHVKFYGLGDYGTYFQVERAAEILEHYDATRTSYSISEIIELYNAQLFVQNNVFPPSYTKAQCDGFKAQLPEARKTIAKFFNAINEANVADVVVDVDFDYHTDLLDLLAQYKVFDRCSATTILPVLEATHIGVGEMLASKRFVQSYDGELRGRLLAEPRHAEHLIRKYLEKDARRLIHLPASFTSADARTLLDQYLDSDDANPNFVELIATAPTTKVTGIDAKLKLKAKRKHDAWTEDFFKNNTGIESGSEVSISDTQAEPVEASLDGLVAKYSYSRRWLQDNLDYPTILNNFLYLFEFADRHMLLALPSYYAELGMFERFLKTTGKDAYPVGAAFQVKEQSSFLQTVMYNRFLKTNDIELESVIEWFFADYLKEEFGADKLKFVPSSKTSSYLERVRHLFSEMESVVKQFSLYVENGELDNDLLAITSEQVRYKDIPSLLVGKYVYANDDQDIRSILHLLFSDQSGLTYIREDLQAHDAARLLIKNQVVYDDFADHQKRSVEYLIDLGVLENTGKRVRIRDSSRFLILKAIYDAEATSYYHYSAEERAHIDDMVSEGWLVRRESLLSEPESSYLNYYLNKIEFSNGPDLRNSYLHGSQADTDDEERHFRTYVTALKLLIALVIKINDDFCLQDDEQKKSQTPE